MYAELLTRNWLNLNYLPGMSTLTRLSKSYTISLDSNKVWLRPRKIANGPFFELKNKGPLAIFQYNQRLSLFLCIGNVIIPKKLVQLGIS